MDVFFTLSGFLITTLLLEEHRSSARIKLTSFWARRARRLMPAQIVMALVVVCVAWAISPPGYFGNLEIDALSAIFYIGNWHLLGHNTSYFTTGAPPSLFTHSWSLAIEEQFYLVWPLVVWALLRRRRTLKVVGLVALSGATLSYVAMQILVNPKAPNRVYYGTDTHALGILAGAALATALWTRADSPRRSGWLRHAGLGGGAVLAVTMFAARGSSVWVYRAGFVLVALATSAVIASCVLTTGGAMGRILRITPLTYIGRISYGIYLWHYPVIALVTHQVTGLRDGPLFAARLILTVALASASYHFVELPLRRAHSRQRFSTRRLVVGAVLVLSMMSVAVLEERLPTYASPVTTTTKDPVGALMLGDSMMLTLDHSTAPWRARHDVMSSSTTVLGCGIGPSFRPVFHGHLIFGNAKCHLRSDGSWPLESLWANSIAASHPDVVVVGAGRWETHDHRIGDDTHNISDRWFLEQMTRGLDDISNASREVGAHVVLLTTPCTRSGETKMGHPWPEDSPARQVAYNNFIRHYATTHAATSVLDVAARMCPGGHFSYFDATGRFMIRNADGVHYGPGAGPAFGDWLWSNIRRAGESSSRWQQRH